MVSAYWMVAGAGFEPTTFGLWARRATELLYPATYNSAVFYSFIIIALCKGCVNSFLHIFLFYALSGFFDWIYLHFNLSFLRVCTQLYGGTVANERFRCLLKMPVKTKVRLCKIMIYMCFARWIWYIDCRLLLCYNYHVNLRNF